MGRPGTLVSSSFDAIQTGNLYLALVGGDSPPTAQPLKARGWPARSTRISSGPTRPPARAGRSATGPGLGKPAPVPLGVPPASASAPSILRAYEPFTIRVGTTMVRKPLRAWKHLRTKVSQLVLKHKGGQGCALNRSRDSKASGTYEKGHIRFPNFDRDFETFGVHTNRGYCNIKGSHATTSMIFRPRIQ